MSKGLVYSIFILLLSSCSLGSSFAPTPKYIKISDSITDSVGARLAKKHDMYVIGNFGALMYRVDQLGISFQIYRLFNREEARELIVDCITEFLSEINCNEEIRPYLGNYPFKVENIKIKIFSRTPEGRDAFEPYIEVVSNVDDKIKYAAQSPDNLYTYSSRHYETFDEALAIVQSKNKN